jgi:hypothetical protein
MFPAYDFYSTSGNSTGPTHEATMSTAIPLPSPSSILPSWVTDERHQKLTWKLTSSFRAPLSAQMSWFRSIYPRESALQSCSPTIFFTALQVPPGAAIFATLVKATTPGDTTLTNTWETLGGAIEATTSAAVPASPLGHDPQHRPGATAASTNARSTGSLMSTIMTDKAGLESRTETKT